MAKKAVILLHGVGSAGNDLKPLAAFWAQSFPDTLFITPDAPSRFDQGGGYQWFSVTGITEQSRPARIVAARSGFDEKIQQILDAYSLDPAADKIILAGFSQGAIMALDALVSSRFPLAGVIAFSGRLASPEPFADTRATKVMLIHGKNDLVIPWTESEKAAAQLTAAGFDVQTRFEEGAGHTITPTGARYSAGFIAECLMSD